MIDEDFEIDGLKPGDMSQLPFSWWKKLLLRFFPRSFMKLSAWELDIDEDAVDYAEKLFRNKKIHLEPLSGSGGRGFIVNVDNKMTLWFYQDSNHFVYDGFEMGEYEDGDVTVVDRLAQESFVDPNLQEGKEIKEILKRICAVCGDDIDVMWYMDRTFSGGHVFSAENGNAQYWKCDFCVTDKNNDT